MRLYVEANVCGFELGLDSDKWIGELTFLSIQWAKGLYGIYLLSDNTRELGRFRFFLGLAIMRKATGFWGIDINVLFRNFFINLFREKKVKPVYPNKYITLKGKQIAGGN